MSTDCGCNRALMAALSPLHPQRYLDLACDQHRAEFVASSPAFRDYVPDDTARSILQAARRHELRRASDHPRRLERMTA